MPNKINLSIKLLTQHEKFVLFIFLISQLIIGFFDFLSIGSIILFLNGIINRTLEQDFITLLSMLNISIVESNILYFLSILIITVFVIKNLLQIIYIALSTAFFNSIKIRLSKKLFNYYLKLPLDSFYNKDYSEYLRDVNNETQVFTLYLQSLFSYVNYFINIIVISSLTLFFYDWITTLILLISFFGLYLLFFKLLQNELNKLSDLRKQISKLLLKVLNNSFKNIREIKIFNLIDSNVLQYKYYDKIKKSISIRKSIIGNIPKHILETIIVILVFCFLFYGVGDFNSNEQVIIEKSQFLIVILVIISRIMPLIINLSKQKGNMEFAKTSISVFFSKASKIKINIKKKNNKKKGIKFFGKIYEIKKLNFSYGKNVIFKDANLSAKKNNFILISGPNSSGKSTLFDLILGLISSNKNNNSSFFIDNKPFNPNDQNFIKCSFQDGNVLNDTIKNNIILDSKIENNEYSKILELCTLDKFLKKLPNKDLTLVDESGIKLSGGVKQKISIARMLCSLWGSNIKIAILDEATSEIDNVSEKKIFTNLKKSKYLDLLFYSSHNISLIKYADKRYKIQNKKLIII